MQPKDLAEDDSFWAKRAYRPNDGKMARRLRITVAGNDAANLLVCSGWKIENSGILSVIG